MNERPQRPTPSGDGPLSLYAIHCAHRCGPQGRGKVLLELSLRHLEHIQVVALPSREAGIHVRAIEKCKCGGFTGVTWKEKAA